MLEPLKQFYCDVCGDIIEKPEDGYIIWRQDDQLKEYGFKIIHQNKCDKDRINYPKSMHLDHFLGLDGQAYLLSFLSIGPIKGHLGEKWDGPRLDFDEFVDFFRRLQTPFYEEARRRFNNPDFIEYNSDNNEVAPYMVKCLEQTVRNPKYSKE